MPHTHKVPGSIPGRNIFLDLKKKTASPLPLLCEMMSWHATGMLHSDGGRVEVAAKGVRHQLGIETDPHLKH